MIEFLTDLGMRAWEPFWVPVLIWSFLALAVVSLLLALPVRQHRLHLEVRMALLIALPIGLLVANLLPLISVKVPYVFVFSAPGIAAIPSVGAAPVSAPFNTYTAIGMLTTLALLLSIIGLVRLVAAHIRLYNLIQSAKPPDGAGSQITMKRKTRDVVVLVSGRTPVAFSCGIFRKRIVIPEIRESDQHLVLLHEMIHHDDGDVFRASIGHFVASLFFFHPLVHLIHREAKLYTELSCDQRVLNKSGSRKRDYALLLLRYARSTRLNSIPGLSMADARSHLYRRIHAMKNPISNVLSPRIVFAIAAFVLLAGVLLSACSESALVASRSEEIEESDASVRIMELPVEQEGELYVIVENMPKLIGGLKGLQARLHYPETAKKAGIEGRVFLQFIVQPDGSTSDITVVKSLGAGSDEEAARVVGQARFIPGVQRGQRVRVKMSLPVTFRLDEDRDGRD